jgi:hypothetical protein
MKKLRWLLPDLPSPHDLVELVQAGILTNVEAKEILVRED